MSMYYDWRKIDGYNAPVTVVLAKRGIGKTFKRVFIAVKDFCLKGDRFVYVVETEDMVAELSQNHGEKFFASILEYMRENQTHLNSNILARMGENSEVTEGDTLNKIKGGTIIIGGETAGYIVSINGFAKLKRNNFVQVRYLIIDEFIPEEINIRHLKFAYKVVSLVQSIARLKNIKIYMLGNTIRLDDIILSRMGLSDMKPGEIRKIKDKYGLLVVCHRVDNKEYEEFTEKSDESVAGRFAKLLKEDNLERNEFKQDIPANLLIGDKPKSSHLMFCLIGEVGSIRINTTKDYSELYVLSDYGTNSRQRITFDKRYQNANVQYQDYWYDVLLRKYNQNLIKFESASVYLTFKLLMNLK